MSRFKTMDYFKYFGPINLIYSQWLGYLKMTNEEYFGAEQVAAYQNDPLVNFTYAHTTGHATLDTLKKLVDWKRLQDDHILRIVLFIIRMSLIIVFQKVKMQNLKK